MFSDETPLGRMATPTVPVCWRLDACSEASASYHASAACYRLAENIGFMAIVKPELELREVERQIFLADVVIRPNNAALEQGPERINRLRMDFATHIFFPMMNDRAMPISHLCQVPVIGRFIRRNKADIARYGSFDKIVVCMPVDFFDHLAHNTALPADGPDDFDLALSATVAWITFALMVDYVCSYVCWPLCRR